MDKKIIAPYVRASKLDSLEESTQIADQSLVYFQLLKHNYPNHLNPAACVVLSLYSSNLVTQQRLDQLSKMQGITANILLRNVSEIRQLLNLKCEKTYEEIAQAAKLPMRFSSTCNKIFDDLKKEFNEEETLNRAAMKAAIMLVVAVKRGYKRNEIVDALSRITSTDQKEILENELTVRKLIGNRYGGKNLAPKQKDPSKPVNTQQPISENKEEKEKQDNKIDEIEILKQEQKKNVKKVQTKLTFFSTPHKQKFKHD